MNILQKTQKHGLTKSIKIAISIFFRKIRLVYDQVRFLNTPHYKNPTADELVTIEKHLKTHGTQVEDFTPSRQEFKLFQNENWFPPTYHGGHASGVWDEKLLEHWVSWLRLGLADYNKDDIFVDVAACASPWAKALRERLGLSAFAIDLSQASQDYSDLSYYRVENATHTTFADASVRGVSLHCAYEMFMGDDDVRLIAELARILKPGGKAIILPLYMHTHECAYSTPEYYGKGYSDSGAKEYVRMDCYGVPSSRKYDANTLMKRVIAPILDVGLKYRLLVLRNKAELGNNIYCHFILEIEK